MYSQILKNQIKCNKCGDTIVSKNRHDFVFCRCKAVAVDGGLDYLKRTGTDYEEQSKIIIPVEFLYEINQLLDLCEEAFNNIRNQKVIVAEGYKVTETYDIASLLSKFKEKWK